MTHTSHSKARTAGPISHPDYGTGREAARDYSQTSCTCCDRDLVANNNAVRWLELDQRDDTYHDFKDVPQESSQGWFVFGLTCAKRKISEAKAKRALASLPAPQVRT